MECKILPSSTISLEVIAVTSALTGPGINLQIFEIVSFISFPDLAISDGFVVTPSTIFVFARSSISSISAVSIKNFIFFPIILNIGRIYIYK